MIVKLTQAMAGNGDGGAFALRPGASHECPPREAARLVGSGFAQVAESTADERKAFDKALVDYRQERAKELAGRSSAKQPAAPENLESATDDEEGDGEALTAPDPPKAPKKAAAKKS